MPPFERERRLAGLAARTDGVVALATLVELGFDDNAITRRVAAGRWERLHRGVYLVGARTRWTAERAGLLAAGDEAALSHGSGGAIWIVRPHLPQFVDVTLTSGSRRSRPGLTVHHSRLDPSEVRIRHGLRVTSPLRTLTDLARILDAGDLERAVHEALVTNLVTRSEVEAVPALRGAAHVIPHVTHSELQRAMLALIRRVGLPEPTTEAIVQGHRVDFLWPEQRLIVETDGFDTHGTRRRFESDRARDARLTVAGFRVLRFTYRQITEQPEVVAARLAAALATLVSPGWAA